VKVEFFPKAKRRLATAGESGHHRVPVNARPYCWAALSIFVLSSAINYLDRQTLALWRRWCAREFHLSNVQYGLILTAFSIAYAAGAPFAAC